MSITMRTRKKHCAFLFFMAISATVALYSCQKDNVEPTTNQPLDYALQVIPDIHEVMPMDLIKEMNNLGALHFGDNPPKVFKTTATGDTILGFSARVMEVVHYIQSDTTKLYVLDSGTIRPYTNYFRFHDQHRGIAKYDFKCGYIDSGPDNYICETAHVFDSVFIMGSGNMFTAYLTQKRTKEHSSNYNPDKPGEREAVILSGEVTSSGIKNFYFGMKIKSYDNPADAGINYPNINDIAIFKSSENILPFSYWDPYQYNN